MTFNTRICHFMSLRKDTAIGTFIFKNLEKKNSKEQKIFKVIIDNKQNFKSHMNELREQASERLGALPRLSNHLNDSEKKKNSLDGVSIKILVWRHLKPKPRDFEILDWCRAGPVLPYGEKVPL